MLRNPVAQFLVVGLVLLGALVWGTSELSERAARREALSDACSTTWLLALSVAQPALTDAVATGDPTAVRRFAGQVEDRLEAQDLRRVKLWSADGHILWSDEPRLVGQGFDLGAEEREILRDGGVDSELSDLGEPENRYERGQGELVEVYTRVQTPDGTPLLFEAYYPSSSVEARKEQVFQPFQRITVGALLLLVLVATPLLLLMQRRLARAGEERARLLASAADASDAERRRIARDLHDGVVQDLAGTAFSVAAAARDEPDAVRRARLEGAAASLRVGLRSLRSLLVEIHPPDLRAGGLRVALEDLLAPASGMGVVTSVEVTGMDDVPDDVPDDVVALVWRVAQEAVRNVTRHARARHLVLRVAHDEGRVLLTVTDDGVGFRPAETPRTSLGLRGLRSLAEEYGGSLEVRSEPGRGTSLRMDVSTRSRARSWTRPAPPASTEVR